VKQKVKFNVKWLTALLAVAALIFAILSSSSYNTNPKPNITTTALEKQLSVNLSKEIAAEPTAKAKSSNSSHTITKSSQPVTKSKVSQSKISKTNNAPKSPLINTGPGNTFAVFASISVLSTVLHIIWSNWKKSDNDPSSEREA
jgi:hypothetical protein